MTYVLDTNVVSALMQGSTLVVDRLAATERAQVALPQPVLAEIAFGIERLPRSKRRTALQGRFDLLSAELPRAEWTDAVSQAYGKFKRRLSGGEPESRTSTPRSRRTPSLSMRPSSRRTSITCRACLVFAWKRSD
jgi:predicted nucleic acid-binding protein